MSHVIRCLLKSMLFYTNVKSKTLIALPFTFSTLKMWTVQPKCHCKTVSLITYIYAAAATAQIQSRMKNSVRLGILLSRGKTEAKFRSTERAREGNMCMQIYFFCWMYTTSRQRYITLIGPVIGQHILCHTALTKQNRAPRRLNK